MKKWCLFAGLLSVLVFASCQKEVSVDSINSGTGSGTGNNDDYQPVSAGSEWNYSSISLGTYSLKSLGTDSVINGVKYYKFDNVTSMGTFRVYASKNNGVYNQATRSIISGQFADIIVLKDAPVGTTWTNTISSGGFSNYHKYTVAKKGIQHSVNNKTYDDVIELDYEYLSDDIMGGSTSPVKIGAGKSYIAKGIGGIETYYTADMFGIPLKDSVYLISATIR